MHQLCMHAVCERPPRRKKKGCDQIVDFDSDGSQTYIPAHTHTHTRTTLHTLTPISFSLPGARLTAQSQRGEAAFSWFSAKYPRWLLPPRDHDAHTVRCGTYTLLMIHPSLRVRVRARERDDPSLDDLNVTLPSTFRNSI